MQYFFLAFGIFFAFPAFAHVPIIVPAQSQTEVIIVEDPDLSQAYYGTMDNSPHTYEVRSEKLFSLSIALSVPDIESSTNSISAIVVKMPERKGRVTEITRINAHDALWESSFEFFGGDFYRKGPTYTHELEPGVYRIQVYTPNNTEKYVFTIGTREEMTIGYFELLGRILEVKYFFEKSSVRILESAFVYIPLVLLFGCIYSIRWYRRRKNSNTIVEDDTEA